MRSSSAETTHGLPPDCERPRGSWISDVGQAHCGSALGRLCAYAFVLVFLYVLRLGALVGTPDGFLVDDKGLPRLNDFSGVYAAGMAVNRGTPQDAYDWARQKEAQTAIRGAPNPDFYAWPYPPTFLAVASILSVLPIVPAMLAWLAATLTGFGWVASRILQDWRGALFAAACPVSVVTIYTGQNGFLSAALLGAGLLALPGRPVLAGVFFGLLAYKPHLGLMIPLALIAARQWQAVGAAGTTVLVSALLSWLAFGSEVWVLFFGTLSEIAGQAGSGYATIKMQSLFGLMSTLGLPHPAALGAHIALVVALAAVMALVWRNDVPHDLKAALLATLSVMASPYQFMYDMTILVIAQLFLVRYLLRTGFTQADGLLLIAINVALGLFPALPFPFGSVAALATLGLTFRHLLPQLSPQLGPMPLAASFPRIRIRDRL